MPKEAPPLSHSRQRAGVKAEIAAVTITIHVFPTSPYAYKHKIASAWNTEAESYPSLAFEEKLDRSW